jgi:hypothetical protein
MNKPTHFEIIDRQTGDKVGQAKTRIGATNSVNKRDNAYGAYRFYAKAIYAEDMR